MNRIGLFWVALFACTTAYAGEPLAEQIRKLDLKLPDTMKAWSQNLRARRDAVNQADRKAWEAIKTKEDWEKFKAPRIEALRRSLGKFPEPLNKPRIEITKTIKGDGFDIANLIYETRPNFYVTANLYSPAQPGPKMPGILICPSHHNPKTQGELQDMGMTWARLGCLVLVPDQLGHGERRNHPFIDASKFAGAFKPGRQDYYFRYNEALQLHLVGQSLMGWMVWDLMRGVDVLLSKPGIDKDAIILLGSVAGGGDPAAVAAALDNRITAVAPFNFGGPQPETKYPLPADAETTFNYMGGGSWESTRNLMNSGKDGFLPWVIVGSVAPRGLIYGHEFAWDKGRDPVWARLQKIYSFYNAADRLASVHGRGSVTGQPPESTHCNNIGAEHRQQMYPTLKKWFGIPEPEMEYQKRLPEKELACWSDEAKRKLEPRQLWEAAAARSKGLSLRLTNWDWGGAALGEAELPKVAYTVDEPTNALRAERGVRHDGLGSYVLIPPPATMKGQKYPLVLAFSQEGAQALAHRHADTMAMLLENGIGICLAEMRGMGTKGERGRTSTSTSLSATELMLGEPVLSHQFRELRQLLAHLRIRDDVDSKRIALWADSPAKPNPPERLLEVPLDAATLPAHAEPGCCLLATLVGLVEKEIAAIYGRGGLVNFDCVLRCPHMYLPHDAIVPGILQPDDALDQFSAVLKPRALRLEALVDGLNRLVSLEEAQKAYASTQASYAKVGNAERFSLSVELSSPKVLARWFANVLKK